MTPTEQALAQLLPQMLPGILKSMPVGDLRKAINQATGLVSYDLEAPSKKLYPVLTPIRNMLGRVSDGKGGTAVNWKAITAIASGSAQLPVQEGKRNAGWDPTTANYLGTYKGYGMEQSATFESDYAGKSFEDIKATAIMINLQSFMRGEEKLIIGGNTSIALGTPVTPTLALVNTGGTIPQANTTYVSVCALTHEGWVVAGQTFGVSSAAATLVGVTTRTNADGSATTINGGVSQVSAAGSQSAAAGSVASNSINASTTAIAGAIAYAWFWGASAGAAQKLGAITYLNSYVITTAAGTGVTAANDATLAADHSQDSLTFDGLLSLALGAGSQVGASTSGAYVRTLATGTVGAGTKLTSDGAGGVAEIETLLKDRWDNYKISPDKMWVSSQQAKDITTLIIANGGAPLLRLGGPLKGDMSQQLAVGGGFFVKDYFNKYTKTRIEIEIHPDMPDGTILFTAATLPYPVSEVGAVWQMRMRRDYYQIEWPVVTRAYTYGIYADGFLQHYFPPALAVITNIGAGV